MKKLITYKVPGGKLIKLNLDIYKNIIKFIKITGDFFIYPEEAIIKIEKELKNTNLNNLQHKFQEIIKKNNINIIGFNSQDLYKAIIDNTKIKIAIAQINISLGDKKENLKKVNKFVLKAKNKKANIICFPEYFSTGSDFENFDKLAEKDSGNTIKTLSKLAKKNKISIVASFIEKENKNLYNAAIFIDSSGKLLNKTRKKNLFLNETIFVKPGKSNSVFKTNYGLMSTMVCYDAIFPEVALNLSTNQAKIIFIPANWPDPFLSQWQLATSARALDNQIWIIATNRVGKDTTFNYFGHSRIIDPFGEVVLECSNKEELVIFEIDLKKTEEFKQIINFEQDRKNTNIFLKEKK